ncbi:MAG TPA: polysaccharide pyruvyl transferase family protein [Allosphingosinicella sp.]|nr:polysaccharide pyruvyl transferase family protein [Allosphingosinicella sp.]
MTGVRRQLAVIGAFGGVNSGDEMILRALVEQARLNGYEGTINVICGSEPAAEAARQDYADRGLSLVTWRNIAGAMRAVAGRDLFIGGGQIIDGTAGIRNAAVQAGLGVVARSTGGSVTVGGVSTRNLEAKLVRRIYRRLFALAGRIVTRDEDSLAEVRRICPAAANKSGSRSDFVFALAGLLRGASPARDRRRIGFAIHHAPHLALTAVEQSVAMLKRVAHVVPPDWELCIVAHDNRADYDLGLAHHLAERVGGGTSVSSFATTDECAAFYRGLRSIISIRMHPIILGACAEAFCVPLLGSPKLADLSRRLLLRQWDMSELERLADDAFAGALGLSADGPLADPAQRALMSQEAGRIMSPAHGAGAG